MAQHSPHSEIEALFYLAERGGPDAAKAARRAAFLTEARDPDRARQALAIAARLEPLDPAPRLALARLHAEAGDIELACAEAEAVLGQAVDQAARARAAFMLGELARLRADHPTARDAYTTALRIEEGLLATDRADPVAARWYARARGRLAELDLAEGNPGRARTGAEAALSLLRASAMQTGEQPVLAADIADAELRLGALDLDARDAPGARHRFDEAIHRYEALILVEPDEPHWRAVLADAWVLAAEADLARDAPAQACAAMDKALALRVKLANTNPAERWALAATWRTRAALLAALNDAKGAADSLAQARALAERFCGEKPGADAPTRFLVHTLFEQADHALRHHQLILARDAANLARTHAEAFAQAPGAAPAWFGDVAAALDRLGEAARLADMNALDLFARAAECRRMALDRAPHDNAFRRGLAAALVKFGAAALDARETLSARRAFEESTALRIVLAEGEPGALAPARDLAVALEYLGVAAHVMGDRETARHAWEDELALAERLYPDDHDTDGLRFRAIVHAHLAQLGGVTSEDHRAAALARLDILARDGALTERDAALRKRLWKP